MKVTGFGLVLAALLFVAAVWLYPFSPHNRLFHVQSCVPIREALRHHADFFPMDSDLCHGGAIKRVWIGSVGGVLLAVLGLVVLDRHWDSRRPVGDADTSGEVN